MLDFCMNGFPYTIFSAVFAVQEFFLVILYVIVNVNIFRGCVQPWLICFDLKTLLKSIGENQFGHDDF